MRSIACAILLFASMTGGTCSEARGVSVDRILAFAQYLDAQKAYRGALLEYKRALYLASNVGNRDEIEFRVSQMYFRLGKYDQARRMAERLLERRGDSARREEVMLLIGRCYLRSGATEQASRIFYHLAHRGTRGDIRGQAWYLQGWEAVSQRDWYRAIRAFRRAGGESSSAPLAQTSSRLADLLLRSTDQGWRSPTRLYWLSHALPGTGQMLTGQVGRGLGILGLHTSVGVLLARAVQERRTVDAVGLGLLGGVLYRWTQRDAERLSRRWQRQHERTLMQRLQAVGQEVSEEGALSSLPMAPFEPF